MSRMFLYGTLKSDGPLAQQMVEAGCTLTYPNALLRNHRMVDMGKYPGVISEQQIAQHRQTGVIGEIWEVPDDIRRQIDQMEVGAGYIIGTCQAEWYESPEFVGAQDTLDEGYERRVACVYYRLPSGMMDSYVGMVPTDHIDETYFRDNGVNPVDGQYKELNLHRWVNGNFPRRENGNYAAGAPIMFYLINRLSPEVLAQQQLMAGVQDDVSASYHEDEDDE